MKIAIAGTGYVGLVTAVCLAHHGHDVTCVDVDENKIKLMQSGQSPIYELDLEELMQQNRGSGYAIPPIIRVHIRMPKSFLLVLARRRKKKTARPI